MMSRHCLTINPEHSLFVYLCPLALCRIQPEQSIRSHYPEIILSDRLRKPDVSLNHTFELRRAMRTF